MLAETYPDNIDRQLMCLCRALRCHVQDAVYLITVRSMLGKVLHAKGLDAEALLEFSTVDSLRAEKGWKEEVRLDRTAGSLKALDWVLKLVGIH